MSSLPAHMPYVKLAMLWAGAWTRWAPAVGPSSSAIQGTPDTARGACQVPVEWSHCSSRAACLLLARTLLVQLSPLPDRNCWHHPAVGTGSVFHLSHPFQSCNPIHVELCQHARCGQDQAQPVPYCLFCSRGELCSRNRAGRSSSIWNHCS